MSPKHKAQVTMLIIVGLVIFIVVSFILYLSKPGIKKISQQSIKKTHETAIDTQPIEEFVAKCLDKLAKDAVVLLGKQGGYIYKNQGGTLIGYPATDEGRFFVKYNNLNVAYNILPLRFSVGRYYSLVPDYPWETFPFLDKTAIQGEEIFEGVFGMSGIPPLTPSNVSHSIQTNIEKFIDNNIASCIDLSIFEKQGYNIVMKQANTSVVIGANDITVKSIIPITITNLATNEFAEVNEFSANLGIRFKDIYYFTKNLIMNDNKNITFNMSDPKNDKDFLNVQVKGDIDDKNSDLIIVADEKSLVYGKPYEYVFARRNRAPALYYIKENNLVFACDYPITKDDIAKNSELKAEDPDEDSLTFDRIPQFNPPTFPVVLRNIGQKATFKVEVNDGKLSDYQIRKVERLPCS